jgi:hypothetical protein
MHIGNDRPATHVSAYKTTSEFLQIPNKDKLYVLLFLVGDSLNFMCRCFRTLCLFHLHRCCIPAYTTYEDGTESVPKLWHIEFRCRGITHKKEYNIQSIAKV